jgi:hypothetical protein
MYLDEKHSVAPFQGALFLYVRHFFKIVGEGLVFDVHVFWDCSAANPKAIIPVLVTIF